MYKHVVLWKLKSDLDGQGKKAQINEAIDMLGRLPKRIDGIIEYEVGINIGDYAASFFDFSLISTFATRDDFDHYCQDAEHNRVVEFIGSIIEQEQIVDYEVGDP